MARALAQTLTLWVLIAVAHSNAKHIFFNTSFPNVCADMEPTNPDLTVQTSDSPYEIIAACFKPEEPIEVEIKTKADRGDEDRFQGFFAQAFLNGDSGDPIGTFETNDEELQTVECFNKTDSAITNTEAYGYNSKKFTWNAPNLTSSDTIVFQATVVKYNSTDYWLEVRSSDIVHCDACASFPASLLIILTITLFTTFFNM